MGVRKIAESNLVNWLTIDGVKMPTPSGFTYVQADFDSQDSARSETGVLVRDVIRTNVCSPEFSWNALTTEQLKTLLLAVNQTTKHEVTFFDPTGEGFQRTITGYAQATRKATVVLPRANPKESLWKFSMAIIEY